MAFLAPAEPWSGLFFSTRSLNLRSAAQASRYRGGAVFWLVACAFAAGLGRVPRKMPRSAQKSSGH